jgi:hypothetical protein
VLILHAVAMCMELGVVGATLGSLLSELKDPTLSQLHKADSQRQKKKREVVATSVSIAASVLTFGITVLGAGDFFTGLTVAGTQIRAASFSMSRLSSGRRSSSRRDASSRISWSRIEQIEANAEADDAEDRQEISAVNGKEL